MGIEYGFFRECESGKYLFHPLTLVLWHLAWGFGPFGPKDAYMPSTHVYTYMFPVNNVKEREKTSNERWGVKRGVKGRYLLKETSWEGRRICWVVFCQWVTAQGQRSSKKQRECERPQEGNLAVDIHRGYGKYSVREARENHKSIAWGPQDMRNQTVMTKVWTLEPKPL